MISIPAPHSRSSLRRGSLLLASCAARVAVALLGVGGIWMLTAWALGWI